MIDERFHLFYGTGVEDNATVDTKKSGGLQLSFQLIEGMVDEIFGPVHQHDVHHPVFGFDDGDILGIYKEPAPAHPSKQADLITATPDSRGFRHQFLATEANHGFYIVRRGDDPDRRFDLPEEKHKSFGRQGLNLEYDDLHASKDTKKRQQACFMLMF